MFAAGLSQAAQAVPPLLVENEYWQPSRQQVWCSKADSFVCAREEAQVVCEEEVGLNGCFLKQHDPPLAGRASLLGPSPLLSWARC